MQLHSEIIFTGCQWHKGLSTNSASLSTVACIRLLQWTFKSFVSQSQPLPVIVTCTQLFMLIYKFWQQELSLSGLAVSLRAPQNIGTVYHPHSEIRHSYTDTQFGSRLKHVVLFSCGCAFWLAVRAASYKFTYIHTGWLVWCVCRQRREWSGRRTPPLLAQPLSEHLRMTLHSTRHQPQPSLNRRRRRQPVKSHMMLSSRQRSREKTRQMVPQRQRLEPRPMLLLLLLLLLRLLEVNCLRLWSFVERFSKNCLARDMR